MDSFDQALYEYYNCSSQCFFWDHFTFGSDWISYQLGKALNVAPISGARLAVMAFIITSFDKKLTVNIDNFSSSGLFTAIITAFISALVCKEKFSY